MDPVVVACSRSGIIALPTACAYIASRPLGLEPNDVPPESLILNQRFQSVRRSGYIHTQHCYAAECPGLLQRLENCDPVNCIMSRAAMRTQNRQQGPMRVPARVETNKSPQSSEEFAMQGRRSYGYMPYCVAHSKISLHLQCKSRPM